jgi:hypothetical protein
MEASDADDEFYDDNFFTEMLKDSEPAQKENPQIAQELKPFEIKESEEKTNSVPVE